MRRGRRETRSFRSHVERTWNLLVITVLMTASLLTVVQTSAAAATEQQDVVTNYTGPGIDQPAGITVGPDGALWFGAATNSIGRITTAGVVTNYTVPSIKKP